MEKESFEDQFKKLTLSEIDDIISKYSDYPMNKTIRLHVFYDQNKDKQIKVSVTDQDRKNMKIFAEFRHNAYAAYSIFDIEKQAFDLLMNQKPEFPPKAPDISNMWSSSSSGPPSRWIWSGPWRISSTDSW